MSVGLTVLVRLRDGRYDAAGLDPAVAEWPPHPARLFCGLVASMLDDADRVALRWLEAQDPPEVYAAAETFVARSAGYVVVNATGGTGSQTWPGRTNGLKQRTGVVPADDMFAVVWPAAQPDDGTLARLVRLAAQVPYVGRSSTSAEVTVQAGTPSGRPVWTRYIPVPLGTPGSVGLRVPFSGYLAALEAAHADGIRAWQVGPRTVAYAADVPDAAPAQTSPGLADGPYAHLLVWGLRRPHVSVGGDDLLTVTGALRRAVMASVADPLPEQVSGHGADGRPHVAYLGLLDVDHRHAGGHLLGVAVAVPGDMPDASRRQLLRGVLGPQARQPLTYLQDGRGRRLELQYAPTLGAGLNPHRWSPPDGSTRWVTATPLMLDRYPGRRGDVATAVAGCLVTAGYPEPVDVQPLPAPAAAGAPHRMRAGTLTSAPRRPTLHCRITFPAPVRGPVVAGALRYFGGGLFIPERAHAVR
ncbi:type I-U CRISPR-associated protein Csb2 [Dactylosporangium sp. NPDC000555]|uniref:type I-G CRISPR-associated protein Csb2 n=1 Tax=Dactylosporangium sp. NPDC000555 TaxID=3154260 RepID=UPI00332DEE74